MVVGIDLIGCSVYIERFEDLSLMPRLVKGIVLVKDVLMSQSEYLLEYNGRFALINTTKQVLVSALPFLRCQSRTPGLESDVSHSC